MIMGYISNLKDEINLYPAALQDGFRFLMETDLSALALGRHAVQGDKIYIMVAEYETEPRNKRRPEAHRRYVDIQYICSGEEMIGSAPLKAAGEVTEDCLKERDVVFYKGVAGETETTLSPGMFAVYFPWDVHRPNCNAGEKAVKVRKVVVKVAVSALLKQ